MVFWPVAVYHSHDSEIFTYTIYKCEAAAAATLSSTTVHHYIHIKHMNDTKRRETFVFHRSMYIAANKFFFLQFFFVIYIAIES